MTDERESLPWLSALDTVLADPVRLVTLLRTAEDDDDAVRAISGAFGLSPEQAALVLDNQFRLLVRRRRTALAEELRIVRAPSQEPLEVELTVTGAGTAVVALGDGEHAFRASGLDDLLDQVSVFLRENVAVPELRPVVLSTGLDGRDPVRVRIRPDGRTTFEYADA